VKTPTIAVPAKLAPFDQWVTWRWAERDGKRTKPPFNARTGGYASSTDSATWSTVEQALAALDGYDGIGFVLTDRDPFADAHLDHCRDEETGIIEPWAHKIVETLSSYTEITPSGTGLCVFVRGTLPPGGRKRGERWPDLGDWLDTLDPAPREELAEPDEGDGAA